MGLIYGLMAFAAVYFVILSIVINPLIFLSLRRLTDPEKLMDVVENGPAIMAAESGYDAVQRWAQEHGFSPEMLIHFRCEVVGKATVFAVWKSQSGHDYLCNVKAPALTYSEFVTTLGEDADLTTCDAKLATMLPTAPQRYLQTLTRRGLDDLFKRHNEGLEHLFNCCQISPVHLGKPANRLIADSVRRQVGYIQTLPLWQLRSVWWYWGRRNLLNYRTIAERYPRG